MDTQKVENRVHHFTEYSLTQATVQIYSGLIEGSYPNGARVLVFAAEYPSRNDLQDRVFTDSYSDVINGVSSSDTLLTTSIDVRPEAPFYLAALLLPAGMSIDEADASDVETLCQSDRLKVSNGRLQKAPHPAEKDTIKQSNYERVNAEGCYLLRFRGSTLDRSWNAGFVAAKHGYLQKKLRERRTGEYAHYATESLQGGNANLLGTILNDAAEANGLTGDRAKVEFLIDFVQNLPYVPDDVGAGEDEYQKYLMETVVDAGGDCEDSSVLLASLLRSKAFGYGTVLLVLPGHMAVGIKGGENVQGGYYEHNGTRYFYIEATGEGWGVGEIPEQYQNSRARVLTF